MKTVSLSSDESGPAVTLRLTEFELTALVALVEEGRSLLEGHDPESPLHAGMANIASEFCSLLGHLELLASNN